MVLSLPAQVQVFLACEATDMRKAFDGLCAIVEHRFHRDPYAGDVFAFLNRRRNYVKLLLWDGNGFWLFAKRLEQGTFEGWQFATGERTHVRIDRTQLMMLLDGIPLKSAKFRRRFAHSLSIGQKRGDQEEAGRRREAE